MQDDGMMIRLDADLKKKIAVKAKSLGLSASSYIRMILIQEVSK